VGKTTCAAATALHAARQGLRTLVMSSDPAHSLADALDRLIGPEPEEVAPLLFAQEVDLYYSMKKHWGHMRELLLLVFKWQGVNEIAAEELAAIPSMGEGSALLWLDHVYHSGDYDLIIIDSAPTGETLTFLTLPQVTEWWLTKAFPFQKLAIKGLGLAVRTTTGIPLDKAYNELKQLFERMRAINEILSDSTTSSIRLVMNPEKMVIQEAQRAYTYLQLYGYGIDAAIVNRILPRPESGGSGGWEEYLDSQDRYLDEIEANFFPLPILRIPHQRREVFGIPRLEEIGETLYGDRNPAEVFYSEPTYQMKKEDKDYVLNVRLPFVDGADYSARQFGDQLVIEVDNQRRNYLLPQFLGYYALQGTRIKDGWLEARFVEAGAADEDDSQG
jgi:arsenite-transporting ATPase